MVNPVILARLTSRVRTRSFSLIIGPRCNISIPERFHERKNEEENVRVNETLLPYQRR